MQNRYSDREHRPKVDHSFEESHLNDCRKSKTGHRVEVMKVPMPEGVTRVGGNSLVKIIPVFDVAVTFCSRFGVARIYRV
jgi:hypothetical protein